MEKLGWKSKKKRRNEKNKQQVPASQVTAASETSKLRSLSGLSSGIQFPGGIFFLETPRAA